MADQVGHDKGKPGMIGWEPAMTREGPGKPYPSRSFM